MNLDATSLMPFGRYKGQPMGRIPASYYNWLWNSGKRFESDPVANYIHQHLEALKEEDPHCIWAPKKLTYHKP